jgi:DASH complex subunit DAD2
MTPRVPSLHQCAKTATFKMPYRRYSRIGEVEAEELLESRLSELQKLQKIETLTSEMTLLLNTTNEHMSKLQLGTDSVAKMTANWIQIVRAVSLAANSMMIYSDEDFKTSTRTQSSGEPISIPTTERLVRCALDDLGNIVGQLEQVKESGDGNEL